MVKKFFWICTLSLFSSLHVTHAVMAEEECNFRRIADKAKTVSILRQVENSLNTLALAQVDAIADIATGVHTLDLYNNESGFYGPLGGLRKTTDKNQTFLNDLDKSIRRIASFPEIQPAYADLRENALQIVSAGYDVLERLKADDAAGATRIYASATVPALSEARAGAYTVMSGLERSISLSGVRCQ